MTREDEIKMVREAAEKLGEWFDAVQILATRSETKGTYVVKQGVGNWYARQGMAHEFIQQDIAQENAIQIAKQLSEEGPE